MSLLIWIVTLSLVTSTFGSHDRAPTTRTPTICKNRQGICERYQQQCSMSSCCDTPRSPGYQTAPKSGKYLIQTGPFSTSTAFCDMETDGGGWTTIIRRTWSSLTFNRPYYEYEEGFGELEKDFWYGLRAMRDITTRTPYEMRFDMFDVVNDTVSASHAFYSSFRVEGENYTLHLGSFSGSDEILVNNLIQFDGQQFYAKREKQDQGLEATECIDRFKAGWWYVIDTTCTAPEGQLPGMMVTIENFALVEWQDPRFGPPMLASPFQKYEMKIRPINCRRTGN